MTQTSFVESCAKTASGSAAAVARRSRGRPKARQLLKLLGDRKKILITTHAHPDPDALASCVALCALFRQKLPAGVELNISFKGGTGGGVNEQFAKVTDLQALPWDDAALPNFDAIILLDTQPAFGNNPLPAGVTPLVVIDHHRAGRTKPKCGFCDIRPDVGAVSSIVFSYYMELEVKITPEMAATLLFAIESDLAGAAGTPGELDNLALSNLTLIADTRKLYRMRYLDLPKDYFASYAQGMSNAGVLRQRAGQPPRRHTVARATRRHRRLPAPLRPGEMGAGEWRDRVDDDPVAAHLPGRKNVRRDPDGPTGPRPWARAAATIPRPAAGSGSRKTRPRKSNACERSSCGVTSAIWGSRVPGRSG
jgi:hypothetical protein